MNCPRPARAQLPRRAFQMPRPKLDGDVTKINFKSNVYYGPLEVPALDDDMKSKKMSPKEKAAYVEKLLEDFDRKSESQQLQKVSDAPIYG